MAKEARNRGCYDRIVVGDAECILHVCKDEESVESLDYDFLFACDLFPYIGDLSKMFLTAKKCLEYRGGIFAFSAEVVNESQELSCGDDDDEEDFVMQSCARFAHKRWYIRSLAEKFGFETLSCKESAVLRKHFDKDVLGALIVLSLPSA
jgi:predicted TPR repeat methyltransferase